MHEVYKLYPVLKQGVQVECITAFGKYLTKKKDISNSLENINPFFYFSLSI